MLILAIVWVIAVTVVLYGCIGEIEKVENVWVQVFSYILVTLFAPAIIITMIVFDLLEYMGVEIDDGNEE